MGTIATTAGGVAPEAGRGAGAGTVGVPSPCISVCRVDAATGWCAGCYRSIDEIAAWASLGDREKLAIWRELALRRDRARPRPAG